VRQIGDDQYHARRNELAVREAEQYMMIVIRQYLAPQFFDIGVCERHRITVQMPIQLKQRNQIPFFNLSNLHNAILTYGKRDFNFAANISKLYRTEE
jgi:site-specific recombinase